MSTFIVTANPPTPNGDLHVGHLSGPYLGADVFTRYQRMAGNGVAYLCFGDDHQSFVLSTAMRSGRDPVELVETSTKTIRSTLKAANIEVDLYTNALGNRSHVEFVRRFFVELYERGVLKDRVKPIPYCGQCDRHLFESFINGLCPYCGEGAVGNLCEACGRLNDPVELLEATCSICRRTPELREYRGLFFPFEDYRAAMAEFYESRTSWRPHQMALCRWAVSRPMSEYPVTYPTDWGIPVPVAGFEGQTINAWFEMFPAHFHLMRAWGESQADGGLVERVRSGETQAVQFCGFDNTSCNSILHIALDRASDGRYMLPRHVITNEFYLLEGEKFSTSRNHAIWGGDILRTVQADALRYYLCRTNPEYMQTSFSLQQFARTVNEELAGAWDDTLNTFFSCLREEYGGEFTPPASELDLRAVGMVARAKGWLERYYGLDEFSLRQAATILSEYMAGCDDYLRRTVLPARGKSVYRQRLSSMAYLVRAMAYFAAPLMPQFSQQLWSTLGLSGLIKEQAWSDAEAALPTRLSTGRLQTWFPLVTAEPSDVAEQLHAV